MKERGFTVGDLLLSLTIIAIAIISFKTFSQKSENANTSDYINYQLISRFS